MECVVPRPHWRCRQWSPARSASPFGRGLQPRRCTAGGRNPEYLDAQRRPGQNRVSGAARECDCSHYDEFEGVASADDLLSLQFCAAVCTWRCTEFTGGISHIRSSRDRPCSIPGCCRYPECPGWKSLDLHLESRLD